MLFRSGFYPPEQAFDNKYHKLTVRTLRKGLDVKYREGYYAMKEESLSTDDRRETLQALLSSPLDSAQIGLSAKTEPEAAAAGAVRVSVRIDLRDVKLEQHDGKWVGALDLATRLESSSAPVKLQTIPLELPEDRFRIALERGVVLEQSVTPASKDDRLRIVLMDRASGHAGSLWIPAGARTN